MLGCTVAFRLIRELLGGGKEQPREPPCPGFESQLCMSQLCDIRNATSALDVTAVSSVRKLG